MTYIYTRDDNDLLSPPHISLNQTLRSWFVYQWQAYNVKHAPEAVFEAYIRQVYASCIPAQGKREELASVPFLPMQDDLERWFVLETLLDAKEHAGLVLYPSKGEALASILVTTHY